MIAGRLHWKTAGAKLPGRIGLAAFDFSSGTLVMTEAGTKRRAALYLVHGEAGLRDHDPGGLEVLDADQAAFRAALGRENHTLKRALTDPTIMSGIGNAYSDEILHRARLSPVKLSRQLSVRTAEATAGASSRRAASSTSSSDGPGINPMSTRIRVAFSRGLGPADAVECVKL